MRERLEINEIEAETSCDKVEALAPVRRSTRLMLY